MHFLIGWMIGQALSPILGPLIAIFVVLWLLSYIFAIVADIWIYIVLIALTFAGLSIVVKYLLSKLSHIKHYNIIRTTVWSLLFGVPGISVLVSTIFAGSPAGNATNKIAEPLVVSYIRTENSIRAYLVKNFIEQEQSDVQQAVANNKAQTETKRQQHKTAQAKNNKQQHPKASAASNQQHQANQKTQKVASNKTAAEAQAAREAEEQMRLFNEQLKQMHKKK